MNNRGFTLIEVVGVVLILAAIFFISFPTFLNISKSDNEKKYTTMVKDLCLAGESYIYANDDYDLSEGREISIEISELIAYGNVDSDLKNPKTDNSVSDDILRYNVESNSLECKYIDK